jgi:asparagine synthase (glutamine-hydrolysing)
LLKFDGGTILGVLFDRFTKRPVHSFDEVEARRIVASRGERLTSRYWGAYVAILLTTDSETIIVRAPLGELPCYFAAFGGGTVCASDAALLIDAGLRPKLAWDAVIRELAWRDVRGTETCLSGLSGLRGGDRLLISDRDAHVDTVWSPWAFTSSTDHPSSAELDDRLRREVTACVAARASGFDHVLVQLSGGLDSSIVAASLANSRTPFSLATMTTRDPLGDERTYAKAVADRVGRPLNEAMRDIARVVPDRSPAARLPRPVGRLFEQESARIAYEIATGVRAQAIVTGGGGDNVFCSLQSAAPVADRLLAHGPTWGAFETAREIERLASVSVPAVLWAALRRLPPRNRHRSPVPDLSFLTHDAETAAGEPPHSWLAAPADALPGTAAHVKLLAAAESLMQGFDPQADVPTIAPLLSQPVVEMCLSIPTWRWFACGLNRAVARRAFARELPELVVMRASKGTPDSFVAEIYERFRPVLRERLLGGVLAAERIFDTVAVDRAFAQAGGFAPPNYRRLLRLADVELWARSWSSRTG